MNLGIGKTAPSFVLKNQQGKDISLQQFRDKNIVVLYFYPKAMTPGCTTQACGLRDKKRSFTSKGVVILGVSPDTPDRLKKFVEKDRLNFDLLSDPDHQVSKAYEVWGAKKFMGREYEGILRTTFVIGQDGKIQHITDKVNTKTHHDDILKCVKV